MKFVRLLLPLVAATTSLASVAHAEAAPSPTATATTCRFNNHRIANLTTHRKINIIIFNQRAI